MCCILRQSRNRYVIILITLFVVIATIFASTASWYIVQRGNTWYTSECFIQKAEYMEIYRAEERMYSTHNSSIISIVNDNNNDKVKIENIMGWVYTVNTTFLYTNNGNEHAFRITDKIYEPGTELVDRKHTGISYPCLLLVYYQKNPPNLPLPSSSASKEPAAPAATTNNNNTKLNTIHNFIIESIFWTKSADLLTSDYRKSDDFMRVIVVIISWLFVVSSIMVLVYVCKLTHGIHRSFRPIVDVNTYPFETIHDPDLESYDEETIVINSDEDSDVTLKED